MGKTSERMLTPEQKEAAVAKAKLAAIKAKEEAQLFDRVFSTPDGKKVLAQIMLKCNYQTQITVSTANGIDTNGMVHNAALHKHYLWLRSKVKPDTLRDVENPLE